MKVEINWKFHILVLLFACCSCQRWQTTEFSEHIETGLFLIHAKHGELDIQANGSRLILSDIDQSVAYFVRKPTRKAGKIELQTFLSSFFSHDNSKHKKPVFSAAFISYEEEEKGSFSETSIVLSDPAYSFFDKTLSFNVSFPNAVQVISPGLLSEVTIFVEAQVPTSK